MSEAAIEVLSLTRNSEDQLVPPIDLTAMNEINRPVAANSFETLVKVNPRLSHNGRGNHRALNLNKTL